MRNGVARDPKALSRLFESLPPHAVEAEMAALGAMLVEPECAPDAFELLADGDFFKPAHGTIFATMRTVHERESTLDIVQLHQALLDRDLIDAIGGLDYLVQLGNAVPNATNLKHYAETVRQKAVVRKLIEFAGDLLYRAHHDAEDLNTLLDSVGRASMELIDAATAGGSAEAPVATMAELMREQEARIIRVADGEVIDPGLSTGFTDIDWLLAGMCGGELLILAARPGMGKSSLAANIAENVALNRTPVGIMTMEMNRREWAAKFLCGRANVNTMQYRRGAFGEPEVRRLMSASADLRELPIFVDDRRGVTTAQFRARANRLVRKHGVKFLVVDYLQLMNSSARKENRTAEVTDITRTLKVVAGELDIPILALSQLNRSGEISNRRPRLSDLRESGSIEQDADVVLLMHREAYYHRDDPEWMRSAGEDAHATDVDIAKQRAGATGTIQLGWNGGLTRFVNMQHVALAPQPAVQHTQPDLLEGLPV